LAGFFVFVGTLIGGVTGLGPGELEWLQSDLAVLADRAGIASPARRVEMDVTPAQATAYIVNPLTGREAKFSNLFLTHPPTEARVHRLFTENRIIEVSR